MSWETVAREHELMPQTRDQDWWRQLLTERPDVMYRLLGDLYQASASVRGKDPSKLPTVDDLRELVTQQYSNDPFPQALQMLLAGRSVRWLAQQMKIHHSLLTRMIRGERDIVAVTDPEGSMLRLEEIARVFKVHPSYFVEWRRLWIMSLMDEVFAVQPNLSIGVWKKFSLFQTSQRKS